MKIINFLIFFLFFININAFKNDLKAIDDNIIDNRINIIKYLIVEGFIINFKFPLFLSLITFGLVQMTIGLIVFKVTSFFFGFFIGGFFSMFICDLILNKYVSDSILAYISIGVILLVGLIVGIILVKASDIGYIIVSILFLFYLALLSGAFIGSYIVTIAIYTTHSKSPDLLMYIICPSCGVLSAVIQYFFPFLRTILFSIGGAYIAGAGYYYYNI